MNNYYQESQHNQLEESQNQLPDNREPNVHSRQPQKMNYSDREVRVFGTKNAAQFEISNTRAGIPTLTIQMTSVTKNGREKRGNWKSESITFQLTPETELIQFIFFLNKRAKVKNLSFKYHGQDAKKSMTLNTNEDGTIFLKLYDGVRNFDLVVPPVYWIQVLTLTYKAYASRFMMSVVDAVSLLNISPLPEMPKQEK
ncbi:hypothetical protein [Enterovibrio norvegicus]|uniref:hypothetical protein n=1 Tax=Enterovibrio norvegicus TaxID=188144 RepID=UPI000C8195DB|nr:hypothetical protein [Enterovibrio norvegicus]PMH64456.1 hypothetical protein BCU62_15490 [Enterovibrio norvegicus]